MVYNFGNRCNNCVIKLNGNEIKRQRSVKHLGNIIDQKLSDVEDCRFKKSIVIGNVNKFIGNYSTLMQQAQVVSVVGLLYIVLWFRTVVSKFKRTRGMLYSLA